MKKYLLYALVIFLLSPACYGQSFSLNDSTIIFKNQEGKILNKEEAQQLMKGSFSTRQENKEGKKIVTIIPSVNDEPSQLENSIQLFRASLLDKPLKSFILTDLHNKKWISEELKGKVVVINFWFTACKPCILEMPHLNKLVADNKENPVVFIAPAPENEIQIKKFLKKYNFDYSIIPSSLDYITELGVENFPTHIIVDKAGIIKQVFIGYADDIKEKLQADIDKLIK
jgi:thiol-disulfide isomerase/thioredoxin